MNIGNKQTKAQLEVLVKTLQGENAELREKCRLLMVAVDPVPGVTAEQFEKIGWELDRLRRENRDLQTQISDLEGKRSRDLSTQLDNAAQLQLERENAEDALAAVALVVHRMRKERSNWFNR